MIVYYHGITILIKNMFPDEDEKNLYSAIHSLKNMDECCAFFHDLCTPKEIKDFKERWKVAKLLAQNLSYREIHSQTKISLTTITRVARFLRNEKNNGYKIALEHHHNH